MSEIKSGRFSIKVDRVTNNTQTGTNGKTSEVIVYKGLNLLTPVNVTPSENQYRVTLSCTGCTAELKNDYKTIYVKNVTASSAKIDITINVENKVNYKKTISVEKVISENEISNMKSNISVIEQKADSISLRVEQTEENLSNNYPTYSKMDSAIDMKADSITSTVSKTYATKDDFNNLNIGSRNMLLKTSDYKTLSCNGTENQNFFLYNISDPSLLAGKTATLTFTYKLSNWSNGQGGFTPQTGDSNYVWFNQFWLWSEGEFEYSATTSFPSNFNDTKFYIRSDWIHGTIEVTEARLVISDKKADWSPAPEDVENRMSTLEQTAETLTAKFTDGFNMGIIEQSIDGIKVKHSSIDSNSYTHMSATGFYIKNKGTDVFRVDANGLYVKGNGDFTGKVTASSGTIGGYTISDYKLTSGRVGMCSNESKDYAFWAGGTDGSNSSFRVGHDGWLYASNASITGTISGSTINGGTINGTTIDGDSFTGDMLAIDGAISAEKLSVKVIENPKYPGTITEKLSLFIGTNGSDDNELESWATFQTFDGLLAKLPKNLNGYEVQIEMSTNITENVKFKGFHGGRIKVLMKGHTLYGYVNSEMCSARIAFYSGYIGDSTNEDNGWGKIHPSKGYPVGEYTTTVSCVDSGSIALYNIDVYGADNYLTGSSSKVGMAAFMWGSIYSNGTSCYGCDIMGRANVGGRIHDVVSWNTAAKYGWYATSGGYITLAGGSHTGGTTNNYQETNAGKVIVVDGTTFVGNTVQKPTTTAPATSTTKTITIKSTYGDTYRSSVYKNWKKDGTVRQGDYGYGDCNGCWFFGDAFSDVEGKTISKVTIKITRQSGGSSSAVGLVVKSHGHSGRPSGAPSYRTTAGTLSLATGASGTLTITNSTILNEIKSGAVKGFGIQTTYDSAHYAVCSGSVTVKITYEE